MGMSLSLALVAASSFFQTSAAPAASASLDVRCYELMAVLAEGEDPEIRAAALIAAQYFLGRADASGSAPAISGSDGAMERDSDLLSRCGASLEAGGHDFRTLGEELRTAAPPPSA